MKAPSYVKRGETVVYYTITLWPFDGGRGKSERSVYKTLSGAEKRACVLLSSGAFGHATIRKEEVWARSDDMEISSSGPVKNVYPA